MVLDFDKTSMNNDNLAMYTRKEFVEQTTYMVEKTPGLLESVEQFTQIPYMLPKLDIVGVPLLDDYSTGGCGLNSYKYVTTIERPTSRWFLFCFQRDFVYFRYYVFESRLS